MLKKIMLSSLVASTLSLGLTACGGGDGGDDSNSNKTLTLSSIEFQDDYIYRDDEVIRNGGTTTTETPIIGTAPEKDTDDDESLVFADKFFAIDNDDKSEQNTKVTNNGFSVDIMGNDNKKITWGAQYINKDISGITIDSKTVDIDLRLRKYFPTDAQFPAGSMCKVITKYTVTEPHYIIYSGDDKDYTLQEWMDENSAEDIKTTQVGANNEYTVAYYDETFDGYKYQVSRIEYKGTVYNPDYNVSEEWNNESCDGYNDIAMDYMIEQIKKKANAQ